MSDEDEQPTAVLSSDDDGGDDGRDPDYLHDSDDGAGTEEAEAAASGEEEAEEEQSKGKLHKMKKIVTLLLKTLPDFGILRGLRVCLDQGYSSLHLARWLDKKGHYFTLSTQKSEPAYLFKNGLHKGGGIFRKGQLRWAINHSKELQHPIVAATWSDRAKFNCLTNMHDPRDVVTKQCRLRKWQPPASELLPDPPKFQVIPKFADTYRRKYHHVDVVSQQNGSSIFNHRCRKWSLTIVHAALVWSVYNCWQLFITKNALCSAPLEQAAARIKFGQYTDMVIDKLASEGVAETHYYHQQFCFYFFFVILCFFLHFFFQT